MPFNSWTFLLFFACVFTLYRLAPTWRLRKGVLLLASYLFYAAWNPPYVLILLFSTTMDWWLARLIGRSQDHRRRRGLLVLSLLINLGLLGFFKYGSFLLQALAQLLSEAGVAFTPAVNSLVLPIGISFYTFASLSYTIDVYRRELEADCSWLDYALFVSFFPHLISGPIVRARLLLPQFARPRLAGPDQLGWGLTLLILGLFCKVVLADNLFAPVVDAVYSVPERADAAAAWLAVFAFSGQIYCDFNGYSLAAIGLALCFGFEFPDNFHYPYAASGFSDFWRRWHITLSSWLRDYLYIPLGGNRLGRLRTYVNLLLTMLLGGLWHGAAWTFVLWGGLHGLYLASERLAGQAGLRLGGRGYRLLVFLVVSLTWIPFRAQDFHAITQVAAALVHGSGSVLLSPFQALSCALAVTALVGWHWRQRESSLEHAFVRLGHRVQLATIAGCLIAMYLAAGGDEHTFIYFQF